MPTGDLYTAMWYYLAVLSVIAVAITLYDKWAAVHRRRRIPEKTLLFVSLIGGSVAMLATMLLIRHKTRHLKFMLGIPAILLLQIAAVSFLLKIR